MSEDKSKAIEMRDRLDKMAKEVMGSNPDMQDHIVACCLAVAIEELEKWIYDDGWTPSVRPYIDNRKFEIPFPAGSEEDANQFGPPWDRKKVDVLDRFPTVKRLKEQGRLEKKQTVDELHVLKTTPFDRWDSVLREIFRDGDKPQFIRQVRIKTGASLKNIHNFVDSMIVLMPDVWGIDDKPGDVCPNPNCGSRDVEENQPNHMNMRRRAYACRACGTQWGKALPF